MKNLFTLLLSVLCLTTIAQSKVTYLKMQRTACFGRCPEYTVEFFKDGSVVYRGKKNVDRIGEYHGKIPLATINAFFKKMSNYKLMSLQELYTSKAADLPRMHLTFVVNGKTKIISNAEEGPAYLTQFGKNADSLLTKVTWTEIPKPEEKDEDGPKLNVDVQSQDQVFVYTEQPPTYPDGEQALMEFIRKNIKYPEEAKTKQIEGKVIISFVVTREGSITDVKVVRGIGGGCDEEALRVVRMMPKWIPGKQNGMAVSVRFNLPVTFSIK